MHSRETQITMVKWTNAVGQTKRANERSFVYRPPAWRLWRNVKTTYNFAGISFFLFWIYKSILLISLLKTNTIYFVKCTFLCRKLREWWWKYDKIFLGLKEILKRVSGDFRGSKFPIFRQNMPLDPRDKLVLYPSFYRLFVVHFEKRAMQGTSRGGWLYPISKSFLRNNLVCIVLSIFRCLQWFLWVRPLESSGDMAGHCGSQEIFQSSMLYRRFWPATIWSYRDHQ